MKKLVFIVLLGGCSVDTYSWELQQAESICKDKGGISIISYIFFAPLSAVTCNDGYHAGLKRSQD